MQMVAAWKVKSLFVEIVSVWSHCLHWILGLTMWLLISYCLSWCMLAWTTFFKQTHHFVFKFVVMTKNRRRFFWRLGVGELLKEDINMFDVSWIWVWSVRRGLVIRGAEECLRWVLCFLLSCPANLSTDIAQTWFIDCFANLTALVLESPNLKGFNESCWEWWIASKTNNGGGLIGSAGTISYCAVNQVIWIPFLAFRELDHRSVTTNPGNPES